STSTLRRAILPWATAFRSRATATCAIRRRNGRAVARPPADLLQGRRSTVLASPPPELRKPHPPSLSPRALAIAGWSAFLVAGRRDAGECRPQGELRAAAAALRGSAARAHELQLPERPRRGRDALLRRARRVPRLAHLRLAPARRCRGGRHRRRCARRLLAH